MYNTSHSHAIVVSPCTPSPVERELAAGIGPWKLGMLAACLYLWDLMWGDQSPAFKEDWLIKVIAIGVMETRSFAFVVQKPGIQSLALSFYCRCGAAKVQTVWRCIVHCQKHFAAGRYLVSDNAECEISTLFGAAVAKRYGPELAATSL